eukprot:g13355.t1
MCVRDLGAHLQQLQVLWLGSCGLQDLSGVTLMEAALRELYLPFNDVSDVSALKWLDLEVLDLEGNALSDAKDLWELGRIASLRHLTLRGNPVAPPVGGAEWQELRKERTTGGRDVCGEDEGPEEKEASSPGRRAWRGLRPAAETAFGSEPDEEELLLERLRAPRVIRPGDTVPLGSPSTRGQVGAFTLLPRRPLEPDDGSVLTRGEAMAGNVLGALKARRGESEALLLDLDIRELLRRSEGANACTGNPKRSEPPFSQADEDRLLTHFGNNINLNGTGAVIASPGACPALRLGGPHPPDMRVECCNIMDKQPYGFHWTRDASLSLLTYLEHSKQFLEVEEGEASLLQTHRGKKQNTMRDEIEHSIDAFAGWVEGVHARKMAANNMGGSTSAAEEAYLEPKWTFDGEPYKGGCRGSFRRFDLAPSVSAKHVAFLAENLHFRLTGTMAPDPHRLPTRPVWEETRDDDFVWNRVVQLSALAEGADFTENPNDKQRYLDAIQQKGEPLANHIAGESGEECQMNCVLDLFADEPVPAESWLQFSLRKVRQLPGSAASQLITCGCELVKAGGHVGLLGGQLLLVTSGAALRLACGKGSPPPGKATEEDRDKLMNQRICPPACWCRGQHLSGALTGNLQQKLVGTTDPLSSHTTLACARASLA